MYKTALLSSVEFFAIATCVYALYFLALDSNARDVYGLIGGLLTCTWFWMALVSNICGELALYFKYFGNAQRSQTFQEVQYVFGWLTVVIGYPCLAIQSWMTHYPSPWINLFLIIPMMQLMLWYFRGVKDPIVIESMVIFTILGLLSHAYISSLVGNTWGFVGAALMIFNVITVSISTGDNLWGFTRREFLIMGLAACSFMLCIAVTTSAKYPTVIEDIFSPVRIGLITKEEDEAIRLMQERYQRIGERQNDEPNPYVSFFATTAAVWGTVFVVLVMIWGHHD